MKTKPKEDGNEQYEYGGGQKRRRTEATMRTDAMQDRNDDEDNINQNKNNKNKNDETKEDGNEQYRNGGGQKQ